MKEYTHKLTIAPFSYLVNIVITDKIAESRVKRNNILPAVAATDMVNTAALHSAVPDRAISYIFLPIESDIGYVAHECYHCVHRIMEFIGAKHENEIMAYMLGYLVRECTRFIMQKGQGTMQA